MAVFQSELPSFSIVRCLQHVKKDIAANGKLWKGPRQTRKIQALVHKGAYFPPELFDIFFQQLHDDLHAAGEADFADYLFKEHFELVDGMWTAPWQCSPARVDAPFSAYGNNAIESFWKIIDLATDDMPKHVDIIVELRELNNIFKSWFKGQKAADIQPGIVNGPNPSRPNMLYVRGSGRMSTRHEDTNKPLRRLTALDIATLNARGPFALHINDNGTEY